MEEILNNCLMAMKKCKILFPNCFKTKNIIKNSVNQNFSNELNLNCDYYINYNEMNFGIIIKNKIDDPENNYKNELNKNHFYCCVFIYDNKSFNEFSWQDVYGFTSFIWDNKQNTIIDVIDFSLLKGLKRNIRK